MRIKKVEITNFRNISEARLEFSPALNFITGPNGQGKTNLLEALYLFSLGRSFRTRKRDEMISLGERLSFVRISAEADSGVKVTAEVGMERGGRYRVVLNGERLNGFSGLIGTFPEVIFTPEDVSLAAGPPSERRLFLDYTACQLSESFLEDLKEYRRTLRQRNSLLKDWEGGKEGEDLLRALDGVLVKRGASIVEGRIGVLREVSERAKDVFSRIFGEGEELVMEYMPSVRGAERDYQTKFRDVLEDCREEEKARGYTTRGPHCDDIRIRLGKLSLRKYGSQGRKRLAAIVMKMTQASVIKERKGETPAVLLDDLFSELDEGIAERVRGFLSDNYQNFITSPVDIDFSERGGLRKFYIDSGNMRTVQEGGAAL